MYHWARTSIQHDAAARPYYEALRARGHTHARAIRSVGDRWLRILIAMLKVGTLYDATRFAISWTPRRLDGTFELRAPRPGLLRIQFAGPLHSPKDVFIFTDRAETLSLKVQLTAPEYSTELANLPVEPPPISSRR